MPHILNKAETACETVADYDAALALATERGWVVLDLGWCPVCRYCILGGNEADPRDRYDYPPEPRGQAS